MFNANFRQTIFSQIERIEINLRCRVANYFSVKYGVLGYEKSENFVSEEFHEQFLDDIRVEISRNRKAPFVKNFQTNYVDGKIPFYALVELMSFGTLSKFYKNMKNEDKRAIADIYNVKYIYLESWIENIAFVRNFEDDEGKSCKVKGAVQTYKKLLENNPALLEYRRNYQKEIMFVARNKGNKKLKDDFDKWKKEAQVRIRLFKQGELKEEALYKWIINKITYCYIIIQKI